MNSGDLGSRALSTIKRITVICGDNRVKTGYTRIIVVGEIEAIQSRDTQNLSQKMMQFNWLFSLKKFFTGVTIQIAMNRVPIATKRQIAEFDSPGQVSNSTVIVIAQPPPTSSRR
ncbi:hypothetical protein HMPREF3111_06180 [Proteus sp. HMSC10D02]|nr:hypothetical protein HMPREF3111_06180 [Proteus sp. HMSC10D02]